LKDDEIDKTHRRLNETKKDCSILAKQVEELNQDKLRLEEENVRILLENWKSKSGLGKIKSQNYQTRKDDIWVRFF